MGVAGTIIGTLAAGYLQGRSQQAQAEAQAAQAEANAKIANYNADKADEAAKLQDQSNKINEENQRRRNLLMLGKQRAAIGASGISATGSALTALEDTTEQINYEAGVLSANNRQKVQQYMDKSTEYTNYSNMYKTQASNYRSLGQQAMTNSMLGAAFTLAGSLYTPKSAAVQSVTSGTGGSYSMIGGQTAFDTTVGAWGSGGISSGTVGTYKSLWGGK